LATIGQISGRSIGAFPDAWQTGRVGPEKTEWQQKDGIFVRGTKLVIQELPL
jgi:hypothetical protein